ncbi:hypothetical protein B0F90DRAFT_674855 [Multifurca ochricompacta]|uniref:Uncharacterized protein n=1 Tax=Multifurca ochricompacta TaxID=376703 RepID=A0AAD4M1X5_9AGAM|nr:hypothetical protein B0F90DRAFT_674855 [Multifurca ochricompacta]
MAQWSSSMIPSSGIIRKWRRSRVQFPVEPIFFPFFLSFSFHQISPYSWKKIAYMFNCSTDR